MDIIDLLEKRIKSRFSHRQVLLFPHQGQSCDISSPDYCIGKIEKFLLIGENAKLKVDVDKINKWNKSVKKLVRDDKFRSVIRRALEIDLGTRMLKNMLVRNDSVINSETL